MLNNYIGSYVYVGHTAMAPIGVDKMKFSSFYSHTMAIKFTTCNIAKPIYHL